MELNNSNIKQLKPGKTLRDKRVTGLQLRAFENSKSFYLYYRTKEGKERRPKLGDYPIIKLADARNIAQDILIQVAQGRDPQKERQTAKSAPTVADLCELYISEHAVHKKSGWMDRMNFDNHIIPKLGKLKTHEVDIGDMEKFHKSLANIKPTANRMLALCSHMFNLAEKWKLRERHSNPCYLVARYPESMRKRYMTPEEAIGITAGLNKYKDSNPASVAFIYLLIFSGARKKEIGKAKWDWLEDNKLQLPDSKTGAKAIYLPMYAMEIINSLPRYSETITGIKDPTRVWRKIRSEAGCPDLRIHDLRHSFASAGISAGLSLAQIGELLGHADTRTTSRYAHLMDDAADTAVNQTADILESLLKIR
jgi:integrase